MLRGLALLLGPMIAYPGNWSSVSPSPQADGTWILLGLVVYVSIILGFLSVLQAMRHFLSVWRTELPGGRRRAFADALSGRVRRAVIAGAAAGYLLVVGWFLALYSWSPSGPGIWSASYPAVVPILCCGPIGDTPSVALLVTPTFELVASPVVLVTVLLASLLFSMNLTVAIALIRRRSAGVAAGTASVGSVGAVLVNCPTCGTVTLGSVLAGSAASGILVGLATYSVPLMLASFPATILALVWGSHQLARTREGGRCSPGLAVSRSLARRTHDRIPR